MCWVRRHRPRCRSRPRSRTSSRPGTRISTPTVDRVAETALATITDEASAKAAVIDLAPGSHPAARMRRHRPLHRPRRGGTTDRRSPPRPRSPRTDARHRPPRPVTPAAKETTESDPGRARRAHRPRPGQGRGPPPHRRPDGQHRTPRGRPARGQRQPPHRLHRQPGHRQDDGRPDHRAAVRQPRPGQQGPRRRGLAGRPRRGLCRPDRAQGRRPRSSRRSVASCSSTRRTRCRWRAAGSSGPRRSPSWSS